MDEYVELNLNFVRALQTGNADGALYFATEIEKKFPNHPNMVAFREVLAQHASSMHSRRGSAAAKTTAANSSSESDEEDEEEDEEDGEEEGEDADESESDAKPSVGPPQSTSSAKKTPSPPPKNNNTVAPKSPPPTKLPVGGGTAAAKNLKAPSVRDFVMLHPSRELDDEVDKMFDDADKQIAAELQRLQLAKQAPKKKP